MAAEKLGYPVGVAVLLQNAAGQVLLGLRARERVWASFGGHLEPTESVTEGALREVEEEVGLKLSALAPFMFTEGVKADGTRFIMLYLTGQCPDEQQPRNCEPDKALELAWFDLDQLPAAMWAHERAVFTALAKKPRS